MECNENCGCTETCENMAKFKRQDLTLGVEVDEKMSWGIDMMTGIHIMHLLPLDMPAKKQSRFIEKVLVYAI